MSRRDRGADPNTKLYIHHDASQSTMGSVVARLTDALRDALAPTGLSIRSALGIVAVAYAIMRTRKWAAGGAVSPEDLAKDLSGKIYVVTGGCGGFKPRDGLRNGV